MTARFAGAAASSRNLPQPAAHRVAPLRSNATRQCSSSATIARAPGWRMTAKLTAHAVGEFGFLDAEVDHGPSFTSPRAFQSPCVSIATTARGGKLVLDLLVRAQGAEHFELKRPCPESYDQAAMAKTCNPIYFDYASTLCYVAWRFRRLERATPQLRAAHCAAQLSHPPRSAARPAPAPPKALNVAAETGIAVEPPARWLDTRGPTRLWVVTTRSFA